MLHPTSAVPGTAGVCRVPRIPNEEVPHCCGNKNSGRGQLVRKRHICEGRRSRIYVVGRGKQGEALLLGNLASWAVALFCSLARGREVQNSRVMDLESKIYKGHDCN